MALDLEAIEARLVAASRPLPWRRSGHGFNVVTADSERSICELSPHNENHLADAEFIAHAPEDIRRLVRELRELRAFAASVQQEGAGRLD